MLAIDASPALAAAAATHDAVPLAALIADAGALPLRDASCDLVVACMSLLDIDNLDAAVAEIGRVLASGGALTVALIHPLASAGQFAEGQTSPPFVIEATYFDERIYEVRAERDGLNMTFRSWHRPFERYARAFADASLVIEVLREPPLPGGLVEQQPARERLQRIPNALHIRARRG